jgi:membrane dipeptidase
MFLGAGADGLGDQSTATLLRHIDHAAQLIGPRHVGLGLDYVFDIAELEGFIQQHPERFPVTDNSKGCYRQVEPERFPAIAEGLLKLGYGEADVQGIMGQNNLRVALEVWQ